MNVTNEEIRAAVDEYLERWPSERKDLEPLLAAIDENLPLCGRTRFEAGGHITCGAAVLNSKGAVLFILNRSLEKWLLPGGHLEDSDTALRTASLRELEEETGIAETAIVDDLNDGLPVDIGIYSIPQNARKGEPAHWHADFCFGFRVRSPLLHLQLAEIGGFEWRHEVDDVIPGLGRKVKEIDK